MSRIQATLMATLCSGLLFGALASAASVSPPARANTATVQLTGSVSSATGQPVKAALVSARDVKTDTTTAVIADTEGRFVVPHLVAGRYEITVDKQGFQSVTAQHSLPLSAPYNVSLQPLPVVPINQMSDADIIRTMPDDDPTRTALGGGGGVPVPVAQQSEKTLVRDRCVRCHTLGLLFETLRTPDEWHQILALMGTIPTGSSRPAGYALTGSSSVQTRILDYLDKYLSPDSKVPETMEKQVKAGFPEEVPVGSGVVYTEWRLPTAIAMGHTAVPDNRGHVFITEWGIGRIAAFDIATGKFTEYPVKGKGANPHGINVAPDGRVWYTKTSDGNIGRLDPRTGKIDEFTPPSGQPGGLNLIIARNGIVWYATPGGIGGFDPTTQKFFRIVIEQDMASPYALIQSKTDDDILWFCVEDQNRVGWVNVKTGESKVLHTALSDPKRPRIDSQGKIWFGYYEGGAIGMVDPATMKITDYPLPFRGSAYAIHVDDRDDVWAASFERGSLIQFDTKTHAMTEYPWPKPGGIVRDIWPDAEGNLWYVHFAWTHNVLVRVERPAKVATEGLKAAN